MVKHFDFNNPHINIPYMGRRHVDIFNEASARAVDGVDKKKLGLIATIGSSNSDFKAYDIDQIICPGLNTNPGSALLESMNYYELLNTYVKEKGYHLALCPKFAFQEYVYEIVAQNNAGFEKQIKVHNLFFTDIKNIISVADDDFFSKLRPENFLVQHGNLENLTNREVIEPSKLENYFTVAESLIGYENNLPEDLALRIAFKKFTYLMKHGNEVLSLDEMNSIKNQTDVKNIARRYLLAQDVLFA